DRSLILDERCLVGPQRHRRIGHLREVGGAHPGASGGHAGTSRVASLVVNGSQPFSVITKSSSSFMLPTPGAYTPGSMQIVMPGSNGALSVSRLGHSYDVARPMP